MISPPPSHQGLSRRKELPWTYHTEETDWEPVAQVIEGGEDGGTVGAMPVVAVVSLLLWEGHRNEVCFRDQRQK